MDVILLFDQYILVKQQNDIHFIWARLFHFVILGFRSLQPELAHENDINRDILRANTLFSKKVR